METMPKQKSQGLPEGREPRLSFLLFSVGRFPGTGDSNPEVVEGDSGRKNHTGQ